MDELQLKIELLEEEMKYLREQIENLKKGDSAIYQQILAKYQEPEVPKPERKIIYHEKEYTVYRKLSLYSLNKRLICYFFIK